MSTQSNRNRNAGRQTETERRLEARTEIEDTLAEVGDDVREKTGDLAHAVKKGASKVWGSVKQAGQEVKEGATDDLANAGETAMDYVEEGGRRLTELEAVAEESIRSRPMTSLAVAAGIGFLFGAFWWRR